MTDTTSGASSALRRATFDPKLKAYLFLTQLMVFAATIVGLPIALLWVLGFGFYWANRQFQALHCELTERSLSIRRGVLFKVEKTIPLEQIQDLTVKEGPLLNAFGLCALKVETAGQSGASTGGSEADLVGIVDPRAFRDEVLAQRDVLKTQLAGAPAAATDDAVLHEVRDLLREIRDQLGQALDRSSGGGS